MHPLRILADSKTDEFRAMPLSTLVFCDRNIGQMWISTERRASGEEEIVSRQSDSWK
jgi:hypothetical protein